MSERLLLLKHRKKSFALNFLNKHTFRKEFMKEALIFLAIFGKMMVPT
jgi:hypothetical protein